MKSSLFLVICLLAGSSRLAAASFCDLSAYRQSAGLEARVDGDSLLVSWEGERGEQLRAWFAIRQARPVIRELAVQQRGSPWATLARDLTPEFSTVSGVRRTGHGLPDELRWWVYWDAPLQVPGSGDQPGLPRRPEEIRRSEASFHSTGCAVRSNGARLEITFPGLSMGIFSGRLQYTVYRGSNLLRQEAVASTNEPSVAYKYAGGLKGFSLADFRRIAWRDTGGNDQSVEFGGAPNRDPVPLRARSRVEIAEGHAGSIAVLPPPHQFFFARQLEINLGFVWYRKDDNKSFSLGVRQGDKHEGYDPIWEDRVFALYNAPPGSWQRMAV